MKLNALLLCAVLSVLVAAPAVAAEGEGGILSPEGGLMVWTLVVFGIVLLVLYKFAYPHLLGAVEAREERIRELLAAAARDRDEARALLEEQQKERAELRTQAQEIFAEAKASGERMREDMLVEARREQEDMLARARRDIEAEVDRAIEIVRRDAVELAISAAEKLVNQSLDDEQNRRLVREFLGEVERGSSSVAAGV
jgi:F-type H+-transporting ATPase subunit b